MSSELLALITAHFICNAAAEHTVLPLREARACDRNFTAVKLAFAGDAEAENYRDLPLAEQVRLNRVGYARYREWLQDNPDAVRDMKEAARKYLIASDGS